MAACSPADSDFRISASTDERTSSLRRFESRRFTSGDGGPFVLSSACTLGTPSVGVDGAWSVGVASALGEAAGPLSPSVGPVDAGDVASTSAVFPSTWLSRVMVLQEYPMYEPIMCASLRCESSTSTRNRTFSCSDASSRWTGAVRSYARLARPRSDEARIMRNRSGPCRAGKTGAAESRESDNSADEGSGAGGVCRSSCA